MAVTTVDEFVAARMPPEQQAIAEELRALIKQAVKLDAQKVRKAR